MAITKIHPIKTTLNLSIDYICDPSKTDEEILISTNGCGYKTAAIEFQKTKESTNSTCKNLARHLIQSFMPGELSPETAHQIGKDLCEKHLQGRHEFVLTTHVDKGHIHNHIIFNNVSFIDGKSYISNKKSYHNIRNISDSLCKNNGLSIATESDASRFKNKQSGTSYKEYQERKKGNSYKAKLQYTIDAAIRKAKDWEDFLRILQEKGYEVKYGKHISFRVAGQERFTRSKTIGDDYSEGRIKERIELSVSNEHIRRPITRHSASKVVDISSNKLAQDSVGFARWLKLQNLKSISKSWSSITASTDIHSFYKHIGNAHDELMHLQSTIKDTEAEIESTQILIQNIHNYTLYKETNSKYETASDKDSFFRSHEKELILYDAAKQSLNDSITKDLLLSVPDLAIHVKALNAKLQKHQTALITIKQKIKIANQLRDDLNKYLRSDNSLQYHISK